MPTDRIDPDRVKLFSGQFICEPLFDPERRRVRGLYRPGARGMQHSTAVMRALRLGPPPQEYGPIDRFSARPKGTSPARSMSGIHYDGADWFAASRPSEWLFSEGDILLMSRDVAMVLDWRGRRYAIGEQVFVIAVLEGDAAEIEAGFEVVPFQLLG